MALFPAPPPLKRKPEARSLPESALARVTHPHRATFLVAVTGFISFLVGFLVAFGVYLLLQPVLRAWRVPGLVPYVFVILFSLYVSSRGARAAQRAIIEALLSHD